MSSIDTTSALRICKQGTGEKSEPTAGIVTSKCKYHSSLMHGSWGHRGVFPEMRTHLKPPRSDYHALSATYNHAVDLYLQENDNQCKIWADQAFLLAQWLEDDGVLREMLMEKYSSLQL